jgi:hypothetical protein
VFKVVMRLGPQVEKQRFDTLDAALAALAERIPDVDRRTPRNAFGRDYEPSRQVAGRLEVRGPGGARGGIDVRGDGSAEAYRGWIRKEVVEQRPGESAVDALRRGLTDPRG